MKGYLYIRLAQLTASTFWLVLIIVGTLLQPNLINSIPILLFVITFTFINVLGVYGSYNHEKKHLLIFGSVWFIAYLITLMDSKSNLNVLLYLLLLSLLSLTQAYMIVKGYHQPNFKAQPQSGNVV